MAPAFTAPGSLRSGGQGHSGRLGNSARLDTDRKRTNGPVVVERKLESVRRVERSHEADPHGARRAALDRIDPGGELEVARDLAEPGVDPLAQAVLIGSPRLRLVDQHPLDHRSRDIERVTGDDGARRHLQGETALKPVLADILEARGDDRLRDPAVDPDGDVHRLDAQIGAARLLVVDAVDRRRQLRIGGAPGLGRQEREQKQSGDDQISHRSPFGARLGQGRPPAKRFRRSDQGLKVKLSARPAEI